MVELNEIQSLIPSVLFEQITDDGSFEMLKSNALEIIHAETNLPISNTRPDGTSWLIAPFAFLIEYLAGDKLSSVSPEYEQRRQAKYKQAFELLSKHKYSAQRNAATAELGAIEGLYNPWECS